MEKTTMQAIEVKETVDRKGNHRLRASCAAGSTWYYRSDIEYAIVKQGVVANTEENRALAMAQHLRAKLGWWGNGTNYGNLVCGELKNGNYVFVFTGQQEIAHTGKEG